MALEALLFTMVLAAPMVVPPSGAGELTVDAFFDDWSGRPVMVAERVVSGKREGRGDLTARVQLGFDPARLYLAVQVVDDRFVPGGEAVGDRLDLVFKDEKGAVHRVNVLLHTLEVRPPVIHIDGDVCALCQAVGTQRVDGWAVEASIPRTALPLDQAGPLKFAALFYDADADPKTPDGVIAAGRVDAQREPTRVNLRFDQTADLEEGRAMYRQDRRGVGAPDRTLTGGVVGDAMPEEFQINDTDIVLFGRDLPEQVAYLYFTHGWRDGAELVDARLQELDGRPGDELIVEHTEWSVPGEVHMRIVEVYGVRGPYLKRMFAQKLALEFTGKGQIASTWEVVPGGKGADRLQVSVAEPKGLARADYYDPDPPGATEAQPLPVPWSHRKPLVYRLRDDRWAR